MSNALPDMSGKVCLITGGTSGVGAATAIALAHLGAHIIIAGRDESRGERVRRRAERLGNSGGVVFFRSDFTSQRSIRDLAARVLDTQETLHVLINNAGIIATRRRLTEDGVEEQFAVNHLAPFLLTNLLLDRLKASAPSRIINVSSNMHKGCSIDFNGLNRERGYRTYRVYGETKLANVLFTYELARRLNGADVTANCLHPGVVRTAIVRDMMLPTRVLMRLFGFLLASPAAGARTSAYLASSAEVEGITGKYFVHCKQRASSPESYDEPAARRLWDISSEMTGIAR